MEQIKFGWAEVDITPEKRTPLAGQFAERISERVEKPITVTALALECGQEQMVILSCDLLQIPGRVLNRVRELLADGAEGLDSMKVIISAIHTHTAPPLKGGAQQDEYLAQGMGFRQLLMDFIPASEKRNYIESAKTTDRDEILTADEYFPFLTECMAKAVRDAWNKREKGAFVNAFGRAVVGQCRRAVYEDGSALMWGETNAATFTELEGGNDSGVELLYIFDAAEKLSGIVINLACPAQCVQHRLFVSPDFWGEVKVRLRRYFGEDIFMLPLCSAAGDQCPVDLIRWVEPESGTNDPNIKHRNPIRHKADPSMFDLDGMRKVGKRIANEVIDVYEEGLDKPVTRTQMEHRVEILKLPLRHAVKEDVELAQQRIRAYLDDHPGDVNYNDAAMLQVYLGTLKRYKLQELMNVLDTEIHVIRLGNIAIATNPFELFLDYGNQIKARSKAEQTFLIQLANGSEGYLPTAKAERGGHYSAFIASGQVGHEGGALLVRETLNQINELFKK